MPYLRYNLGVFLTVACFIHSASGYITHATCRICEHSDTDDCSGFLPTLPLRTAPEIITTALITGILGAWHSAGSGNGNFFYACSRAIVQAFLPEHILWRQHPIVYAMYPKFYSSVESTRELYNCERFNPTKAQIVAVSLGLLAVSSKPPPLDAASRKEPTTLLGYVAESRGDIQFDAELKNGYRIVSLREAVFLPHLFHGLPKGRSTVLGISVPQFAMTLLLIQTIYYITYVIARTSQGLYTTVLEWFFVPASCALIALGLTGLLWEPAWTDIAHVDIPLGEPLERYPWDSSQGARIYFGVVVSLVVPIGPITMFAAYGTQILQRPFSISPVILAMGIVWTLGFTILAVLVMCGVYKPFEKRDKARERAREENTSPGSYYTVLILVARLATFVLAIVELCSLPSQAYLQMSWAQYIPHL